MKREYHKYTEWEDYAAGMFAVPDKAEISRTMPLAAGLLRDDKRFAAACQRVVESWPIAAAENLTNDSCNRRAWLGQASCCIVHGVTETATRIAWQTLNDIQRFSANNIATKAIASYEESRSTVCGDMDEQVLF